METYCLMKILNLDEILKIIISLFEFLIGVDIMIVYSALSFISL